MRRVAKPVFIIILLLAFLAVTEQMAFRHGLVVEARECAVQQALNIPAQTDFLVLGSSRMALAVDPDLVSEHAGRGVGTGVNLGRAGRSPARSLTMLKDMLSKGVRPSFIVAEVNLTTLGNSRPLPLLPPPLHEGLLPYTSIMADAMSLEDRPWLERATAGVHRSLFKLEASIKYLLSGEALRHLRPNQSTMAIGQSCLLPLFADQNDLHRREIERARLRMESRYGPLHAAEVDGALMLGSNPLARRELAYTNRVRALAAEHGIRVFFTRPWHAYQPPLSEQRLASIRQMVPEFIYPHAGLVRSTWGHFRDRDHMKRPARRAFSRWLGEHLKTHMPTDPAPQRTP